MKLSYIESIIDDVDPYFLIKDMGISIDEIESLNKTNNNTHLYSCKIKDNQIRILPFGYINLSAFNGNNESPSFYTGTAIDLLAYYFYDNVSDINDAYSKAFKLFFKHYGEILKTKLLHEPIYIEKLIKNNFIKRHNLINFIITNLKNTTYNADTRMWMQRNGIQTIAGFGFQLHNVQLYKLLKFISDPELLEFDPNNIEYDPENYKVYESSEFATFINQFLFNHTSQHWIIIPYFSDFHNLSFLKIIDPKENSVYTIHLRKSKIAYAGLFALPPIIDFDQDTIRLLESLNDTLIMQNYMHASILNRSKYYLAVSIDDSAEFFKSNFSTLHKPLFLNTKNSSLHTIKALYDNLLNKNNSDNASNLYICDFDNFKENNFVYTYHAFLENQIKLLMKKSSVSHPNSVSPELNYFFNIFDVSTLPFKKQLLNWMKINNFSSILHKLNSITNESIAFKNFTISITNNGYICNFKDKPQDTNLLTNFILKIDQSIIFQNLDDILYIGRLIMGDTFECSVFFNKKELNKKGAIENIALRAYSKNKDALFVTDKFETSDNPMPVVFDSNYEKHLITVLKHDITKASCKYGSVHIGWDKLNATFTALYWQANALQFNMKSQYIYDLNSISATATDKDIQNVYSNLAPSYSTYSSDTKFLNSEIRDIICVILAYLYRIYLGYPVRYFTIHDSAKARNLIKFIFLALGQIKFLEIPTNTRILNSNKYFNIIKEYPFYARCNDDAIALKYCDNIPCVLFIKDINREIDLYMINYELTATAYKQVTKFTLDTFNRFFKWIFNIKIEEFNIDKQECESNTQLIEEGKRIFKYLWWKDVISECDKSCNIDSILKLFINSLELNDVYRFIYFYPEKNCYVLRRSSMSSDILSIATTVVKCWRENGYAKNDPSHVYYTYLDKEKFDSLIKELTTKDFKQIDTTKFNIFVSEDMVVSKNWIGKPERSLTREKFNDIYNT